MLSLHTQYATLLVITILFFFLFLRHTVTDIAMRVVAVSSTTTTPTPTLMSRVPLLCVGTGAGCVVPGDGSVVEELGGSNAV